MGSARLLWDALRADLDALGLGLSLLGVVGADAVDEGLSALTLAHVFDADVDALGQDAGVDALVNDDSDGVLGHIEDATSLAVVELVRKTGLHRTVADNINIVALFVVGKQPGQRSRSVASERLGEQVSRFTPLTFSVRHLSLNLPII